MATSLAIIISGNPRSPIRMTSLYGGRWNNEPADVAEQARALGPCALTLTAAAMGENIGAFGSMPACRRSNCRYLPHFNCFFEPTNWWISVLLGIGSAWAYAMVSVRSALLFLPQRLTAILYIEKRTLRSHVNCCARYQPKVSRFLQ